MKKNPLSALLILFSLTIPAITLPFSHVSAISGSQFNPGRIIDDVVFFSANTMSVGEIQNFLNSKVPVCETWHSSSNPSFQPPFTCLKDYRQDTPNRPAETGLCNGFTAGNKSAAQIIYEVGQSCGINPQVLLVLLQKEQALVTDTWPWEIQYRTATGYGCPDTAACDSYYYGFFNQVYAAARQFRYYANNPTLFNYRMGRTNFILYNPNSSCGGSDVYIQNQATAGLYNYTPYRPNQAALNNLYGSGDSCSAYGNRNFWRLFNDWFGASVIGQSPSPLYKSSSNHHIYVIAGGKKHYVPSFETMVNYGLQKFPAATVDDSFLGNYPTGDSLTSIGKKTNDPSGILYLFDDGKRYPITISACAQLPDSTPISATSWGLDCFNSAISKTLANELVDLYTIQDIPLPQVILNRDAAWKMENGKKRRITHGIFIDVLGGWNQVRWMKDNNAFQPEGKLLIPDNSLVKFDNSPIVNLLADAKLHPIPGPGELRAAGLGKLPTYNLPASYNATDPLPTTHAVGFYAKDSANNSFLLAEGSKITLQTAADDWPVHLAARLPDSFLVQLPTRVIPPVFRSDNGTIFTVFANRRYIFPTPDDFYYLGFHHSDIVQVGQAVEDSLMYGGMHLSSGRLYKISGGDTIYYVYGAASLIVNASNYPGLPYNKLITIDSTTSSRYPVVGTYQP